MPEHDEFYVSVAFKIIKYRGLPRGSGGPAPDFGRRKAKWRAEKGGESW